MSEINVGLVELAGLIYGDGYINKRGEICMFHSISQKEYLYYKKNIIENYGFKTRVHIQNYIGGFGKNKSIVLTTTTTSFSKELRNDWYVDSKKNIPNDLLRQFGWKEWGIIYQDDGRMNKIGHYNSLRNGVRQRVEVEPWVNRYEICLGYPSDDELLSLQYSLSNLGVYSSILKRKDGQRNISISRAESKILFYENIRMNICDSMIYKMNLKPTISYTS